jgi:hypothetical protein
MDVLRHVRDNFLADVDENVDFNRYEETEHDFTGKLKSIDDELVARNNKENEKKIVLVRPAT